MASKSSSWERRFRYSSNEEDEKAAREGKCKIVFGN